MTHPMFAAGPTPTAREVLHGEVWLHFPGTVLSDDVHGRVETGTGRSP